MENRKLDIIHEDYSFDHNPVLRIGVLNSLYEFITERYSIYKKREKGLEPPWSDSQIFNTYKFTNVRREHDKVSKWLIDNISTNNNLSNKEKLMRSFLFRMYNRVESGESLGLDDCNKFKFDYDYFYDLIDCDFKFRCQSNAYRTLSVNTLLKSRYPNIPARFRHMFFVKDLDDSKFFDFFLKDNGEFRDDLDFNAESVFNKFKSIERFGDFLSYQLFVDLTYIPDFPISENEFVIAGPGCKRGLDDLFSDYDGLTYEESLFYITDNLERLFKDYINPDFSCDILFDNLPECDRKFNVMSIENCFCELHKYITCCNGGKTRKYNFK